MFVGLAAKIIDRTNNMSDVYCAFYDFSCILKSKVWSMPIYNYAHHVSFVNFYCDCRSTRMIPMQQKPWDRLMQYRNYAWILGS